MYTLHILLISSLLLSSHAQQCRLFSPSATTHTVSLCAPYIHDYIYMVTGATYEAIEASFNTTLNMIAAVQPITSIGCFNQLLSMMCNTIFPRCYAADNNTAAPVKICKSTCETVRGQCADLWSFTHQPLNCSQTDTLGSPLWPSDEELTQPQRCMLHLPTATIPLISPCPYPLVEVEQPGKQDMPCAAPCPDPTFSLHQWHAIAKMMFALSFVGVLCMFFLSLHYIACPDYRNPTNRFQLYSFVSIMMWEISICMGGVDPLTTLWCQDRTTYSNSSQSSCALQGVIFIYFGLCAGLWLAISSATLYTRIANPNFTITRTRELLYCLVAFGCPFVLTVVPASQQIIQFYWRVPLCFAQGYINGFQSHYIFFYIPFGISVLVAIAFLIATTSTLLKHWHSLKEVFDNAGMLAGKKRLLYVNIRLLVWCVSLTLIFLVLIIYRILLGENSTVRDWVLCKIKYQIGMGTDEECPQAHVTALAHSGRTFMHYAIVSSMGIFSFLATGTKGGIYLYWRTVLEQVRRRDWKSVRVLLTEDENARNRRAQYALPSPLSDPASSSTPNPPVLFTSSTVSLPFDDSTSPADSPIIQPRSVAIGSPPPAPISISTVPYSPSALDEGV